MTIPEERLRALKEARQFLRDLRSVCVYNRVHKEIRERAMAVLRHYPHDYELEELPKALPKLFGPLNFNDGKVRSGPS